MTTITTFRELARKGIEETEAMRGGADEETNALRRKVGLEEVEIGKGKKEK